MSRSITPQQMLAVGTFCLLSGLLATPAQAVENASDMSRSKATTASRSEIAAGSVEDSLRACLARIPNEATAGQRMIAEQSCQRDEADRAPFQASGQASGSR